MEVISVLAIYSNFMATVGRCLITISGGMIVRPSESFIGVDSSFSWVLIVEYGGM